MILQIQYYAYLNILGACVCKDFINKQNAYSKIFNAFVSVKNISFTSHLDLFESISFVIVYDIYT